MKMSAKRHRGFTLVELMIVVVVAAVLLTIALLTYQNYIRKAKRADAMDALMTVQQLQERYRANNTEYAGIFTGTGLGISSQSLEGYYDLSLANATSTGYQVDAEAIPGTSQEKDAGCTIMVIAVDEVNPRGKKSPEQCW